MSLAPEPIAPDATEQGFERQVVTITDLVRRLDSRSRPQLAAVCLKAIFVG
jgi:hypothetical protein